MKRQFDIWRFDFPDKGEHPVVLVSHPDFCARAVVNVLFLYQPAAEPSPKPFEVTLNGEDGMDWETFCDCSILYAVSSAALFGKRGRVSLERRRAIRAMLRDMFRLAATD